MLTAQFLLIAAPIGFMALTGYLLAQVMPLPIALMPLASDRASVVSVAA